MKPSKRLNQLDVNNIMEVIDYLAFVERNMDRLYDEIRFEEDLKMAVTTALDDLLPICMEMSFLKGMQFQKRIDALVNITYD